MNKKLTGIWYQCPSCGYRKQHSATIKRIGCTNCGKGMMKRTHEADNEIGDNIEIYFYG